jgi:hypothetical protein
MTDHDDDEIDEAEFEAMLDAELRRLFPELYDTDHTDTSSAK